MSADEVAPPMPAGHTKPPAPASSPKGSPDLAENWLENFYKECGREATLAYTTLNQMKNWAMLVAAAAISGLSFGASARDYPTPVMFAGSVIVYTFVLRFYVRAILCYINLVRWNVLQSSCVQWKLKPKAGGPTGKEELQEKFLDNLQHYYFEWLSPIGRKAQLYHNLKLGFYLLFGLALFFLVWGVAKLWGDNLVRGLTVFAILNTALEVNDFFKSKYFDTVVAWEKKKNKGKFYEIFPVPASEGGFLAGWIFNVAISSAVATWPNLKVVLLSLASKITHLIHWR